MYLFSKHALIYFSPWTSLLINPSSHLQSSFQSWYASRVKKQIQQAPDSRLTSIEMRLSVIKPVYAEWLIDAYNYIKSQPEIINNGFKAAGILDKIGT